MYCTDITPCDLKQAAGGAVNQHEKLCSLTTPMHNERTQNFESVD